MNSNESTPLHFIAAVSRVVSRAVDRIAGDRGDYPLLVCVGVKQALSNLGIQSQIMYGPAAWVEVMENHSIAWTGCWGESFSFWVATQYGEVIDLNVSVSNRKRAHSGSHANIAALYSPPMVWSKELPHFFRYKPEGIAEFDSNDLPDERDRGFFKTLSREIDEKLNLEKVVEVPEVDLEFPNEPILVPGRRILDDTKQTFKSFERAILVKGIPEAPIF